MIMMNEPHSVVLVITAFPLFVFAVSAVQWRELNEAHLCILSLQAGSVKLQNCRCAAMSVWPLPDLLAHLKRIAELSPIKMISEWHRG